MDNEEVNCIDETFEESINRRLTSLEDRVGRLNSEIRMHSSTDIGTGKKTIYLKGRVDDLEGEIRKIKIPKDN